MTTVVLKTELQNRIRSGKVRDIYQIALYEIGDQAPAGHLLMIATDRISAFDVVLPTGIPFKGEVLTRLSSYWFERTSAVVPNHFVALLTAENASKYGLQGIDPHYFGRSMIVRQAQPLPVECVVRGFLAGSAWTEYQISRSVCGIPLPDGLVEGERLFEPIFTPTSKAQTGHDEPITYQQVEDLVGPERAHVMKLRSLALYRYAADQAMEQGIIIADTKFEFGIIDDEVALIDEVLTPDSSRFWLLDQYQPGGSQPSFDKQPVRDWLTRSGWNKQPPGPELPSDLAEETSRRYQAVYRLLTGEALTSDLGQSVHTA